MDNNEPFGYLAGEIKPSDVKLASTRRMLQGGDDDPN